MQCTFSPIRLQLPPSNNTDEKIKTDPSLTECIAYNIVPSDPLNSDNQIYSDIQTDTIDPLNKYLDGAGTGNKRGNDVSAGNTDPSTTECVAYNIVPSNPPDSDNLDCTNYQECAIMDKKQRKINDFTADPSTNEVVAYNVVVLDPQNSDYSEIQAGTIVDPLHKHLECATTDQKQNGHHDHVIAGSADPLTIMYLDATNPKPNDEQSSTKFDVNHQAHVIIDVEMDHNSDVNSEEYYY